MTERLPSLTDEDGTTPGDPEAITEGEVYVLEDPEEGTQTVEITRLQYGTDEEGNPVPTIVSYQVVPETDGTGGA